MTMPLTLAVAHGMHSDFIARPAEDRESLDGAVLYVRADDAHRVIGRLEAENDQLRKKAEQA